MISRTDQAPGRSKNGDRTYAAKKRSGWGKPGEKQAKFFEQLARERPALERLWHRKNR